MGQTFGIILRVSDRFRNSDFGQTSNGLQTDFCFQTSDKPRILDFELHIYRTSDRLLVRFQTDFGHQTLDFGVWTLVLDVLALDSRLWFQTQILDFRRLFLDSRF